MCVCVCVCVGGGCVCVHVLGVLVNKYAHCAEYALNLECYKTAVEPHYKEH